jgi:pimeloyl-ACP methyl ester carboxylesterase
VTSSKSIAELQALFGHLPDKERVVAEFAFFMGAKSITDGEHILVLIHGINTDAEWQEALADYIRSQWGMDPYVVGYGNFNPVAFLWPYWDTRIDRINYVVEQLRALRAEKPNAKISIIAHSFGTYIMSEILSTCSDLVFHRILFCGAVVKASYKWQQVSARFTQVVNDVGTKDIWPILARRSTWIYGDSGAFGFKNVKCRDRHFDFAHSDFLRMEHAGKYWKPFLLDGEIVPSEWTQRRQASGFLIKVLRYTPLNYFLWIILTPGLAIATAWVGIQVVKHLMATWLA